MYVKKKWLVHCYVQNNINLDKLETSGCKVNDEKDLIEPWQSFTFWVGVNQGGQGLVLLFSPAD